MKNYICLFFILLSLVILTSCNEQNLMINNLNCKDTNWVKYPGQVINIKTHNYAPDFAMKKLNEEVKTKGYTYRDSIWGNDFGKTVYGESDESIVLPQLQSYLYLGSLLKGNSISDMKYQPITSANIKPITVSVSFPGSNVVGVIEHPSLANMRQFLRDKMKQNKDVGSQIASFNFNIDNFTSYDELRLAFGSNVNTSGLFSKHTSSYEESQKISKTNGLYIKYVQRNFTLDMDLPKGSLVEGNLADEIYSPVYVRTITYGKIAVLAIETNELSEYARKIFNSVSNKIFVKKETTLTSEEIKVLNDSEMRLYTIGESGESGFSILNGYEDFVKHLSQEGSFSVDKPGVPIYCSYSYLADNSPVKTQFKFDITTDPLYVSLELENPRSSEQESKIPSRNGYIVERPIEYDVYLKFYSDPLGKNSTFPSSFIKFNLEEQRAIVSYIEEGEDGGFTNYSQPSVAALGGKYSFDISSTYHDKTMLVKSGFVPQRLDNINYIYYREGDINYDPTRWKIEWSSELYSVRFSEKRLFYKVIRPKKTLDLFYGKWGCVNFLSKEGYVDFL